MLDEAMKQEITALFERYPTRRATVLAALHMVQEKHHQISEQAMLEIGELLEISPAEVSDTAGFYEMYSLSGRGRHLIGVCESLSCELCGCDELLEALEAKLGIKAGQTTTDKRITLITMQCLGACDFAPAMLVDKTLYKNVTIDDLDDIINQLD